MVPFDEKALFSYARSPSVEATRKLEAGRNRIGNAVDLTAWVIQAAADPDVADRLKTVAHTNWNLDADRGYGYKVWRGDIPEDINDNDGVVDDEQFVDAEEAPVG